MMTIASFASISDPLVHIVALAGIIIGPAPVTPTPGKPDAPSDRPRASVHEAYPVLLELESRRLLHRAW